MKGKGEGRERGRGREGKGQVVAGPLSQISGSAPGLLNTSPASPASPAMFSMTARKNNEVYERRPCLASVPIKQTKLMNPRW